MSFTATSLTSVVTWLSAAAVFACVAYAGGQPTTALSGQLELARLVDLCAERLNLELEYDAKALKGATVTLRLGEAVDDEELWSLANQLLVSRGLTSVQMPGDDVLSIVRLAEASARARIEPTIRPTTRAWFATVVVPLRHQPSKRVIEAVTPLISKPGGSVTALGGEPRLLLSDVRPRVNEILDWIQVIDVPHADVAIRQVPVEFLDASQVAALVTGAVTARNTLATTPLDGKLTPLPDGSAVVLVAPEHEVAEWIELIDQFDRRQAVTSRTYAPRHFSLVEVGELLEETAQDQGPRGSADRWRIVTNVLTGTLIVTATANEHQRIEQLIERLDAVPVEARRPIRSFRIRNRGVVEILDILSRLIEAGALDAGRDQPSEPNAEPAARQRTERDVLPPGALAIPGFRTAEREPAMRSESRGAPMPAARATSDIARSLVLTADEGTNTLIAIGEARRLAQIEELLRTLDVRQPQVMLEAMVLSMTDGNTRDLGVELQAMAISGSTLINLASLFGLGMAGLEPAETASGAGGTALVLSPGDFRVLIRALETINEGRNLNISKVLVNNNQQASLDSVLQEPFLSTNASTTVATTSFGGTQDAGITVTVTPQIAEGDHLVLEYSLSLSAFVGESTDPSLPPPRQQNTVQSVVTIPDGYTVVVGGLDVTTTAEATSQVPFLGDLPLVGELFKSRSASTSRARFYLFIRVNILRHGNFEDLKYLSGRELFAAKLHDGWPVVEPRVIE